MMTKVFLFEPQDKVKGKPKKPPRTRDIQKLQEVRVLKERRKKHTLIEYERF